MGGQIYRIDRDRARFKEVVRGRIREDLQRYLASSELIGKRGDRVVSVPVPSVELPRFRFGSNDGGVGQGPGEVGDAADGRDGEADGGAGGAGEQEGTHILEAEVELEELASMLGEELGLPNILPRGRPGAPRELDAAQAVSLPSRLPSTSPGSGNRPVSFFE